MHVYPIEDQVPPDWTVGAISHGGRFDLPARKVKWGPFLDNLKRQLTYEVTPPNRAGELVHFTGTVYFDDISVAIPGDRQSDWLIETLPRAVSDTMVRSSRPSRRHSRGDSVGE